MKKSKFTEQQIAFALKRAELGTQVEEVCRKVGIRCHVLQLEEEVRWSDAPHYTNPNGMDAPPVAASDVPKWKCQPTT
jgi:hypothetical protein